MNHTVIKATSVRLFRRKFPIVEEYNYVIKILDKF